MDSITFNCGTAVSSTCAGLTVPMTDAGFQLFVGQLVSASTFLLGSMS